MYLMVCVCVCMIKGLPFVPGPSNLVILKVGSLGKPKRLTPSLWVLLQPAATNHAHLFCKLRHR